MSSLMPPPSPPIVVAFAAWLLTVSLTGGGCTAPRGAGPHDPVATQKSTATGAQLAAVLDEAGCRECHNQNGEASESRLIFPRPGASAHEIQTASATFWDLVDAQDPTKSRLFRKPTKRMMHEGGERIVPGSPEEKILLAWLTEAAAGPRNTLAMQNLMVSPRPVFSWPVRYQGRPSLLRRLSRDELVATVQLLIGVAPLRTDLPEEPHQGHGPLITVGVPLLATEIRSLQVVMDDFALKVGPQVLMRSGCTLTLQPQRQCLGDWATGLAARAFRRKAFAQEATALHGMFAEAGKSENGDVAAVQAALSSIFLAPSFLYREEIGTAIAGQPGLRALRPDEIASRLSFLATLTPPDDALLAAAKAGKLSDPDERIRHFNRIAATERGRKAQAVFVLQWLGANEAKLKLKSRKYNKELGDDFEASVRASAEGAIRQVLFESDQPTVAGLLSTTTYLQDESMKKLSRPSGEGTQMVGDNEQTGRIGLMMHPQVLAAHTKENGASPFQIGAFLREALLCEPVPPPPVDAAASARTNEPSGLSTRQGLEFRTSAGRVCSGCHQSFAPLGYSFLPFDPVGRWVHKDPTGKPWDLSGTIATSSGEPLRFGTPAELMRGLANHPQVLGCFAQAALQWTLGRALVTADQPMVMAINEATTKTRGNLAAIFRAIVATPGFVTVVAPR